MSSEETTVGNLSFAQLKGSRPKRSCFRLRVNLTVVEDCHGLMVNTKTFQSANVIGVGSCSTYAQTKCISCVCGHKIFQKGARDRQREQLTWYICWKRLWQSLGHPSGEPPSCERTRTKAAVPEGQTIDRPPPLPSLSLPPSLPPFPAPSTQNSSKASMRDLCGQVGINQQGPCVQKLCQFMDRFDQHIALWKKVYSDACTIQSTSNSFGLMTASTKF